MERRALLASMLAIRAFEDALAKRPDAGFQLYSSGEEAVAVGVCAALRPGDQLLSSGRSIGPALARGLDPGVVMAELLGRADGPCKGKGGRGHLAQPGAGFFGAHAVVGGNLTIAAGVALAMRMQRAGGIVACIFGDGACGSGALHETMNIAALWKLPLLLVCDDNGWSISTPREAAPRGAIARRPGRAVRHPRGKRRRHGRARRARRRGGARRPRARWCRARVPRVRRRALFVALDGDARASLAGGDGRGPRALPDPAAHAHVARSGCARRRGIRRDGARRRRVGGARARVRRAIAAHRRRRDRARCRLRAPARCSSPRRSRARFASRWSATRAW
jgi:pyruvate dehydrogenase E1 component alpha subunit